MKTKSAIYILQITLESGEKAVKLGYTDDINERFKNAENSPSIVLYVDRPNMARSFVASIKDHYKDVEIVKGWYPIHYSTILELVLISFEQEIKNC